MTRRPRAAEAETAEVVVAESGEVSAQTLEALVVGGDLSKLTPGQRVEVYMARCSAAGLDPRTQPFAYLQLSGKLTLYATKAATDQLVATRRLSVQVVDRRHLPEVGLYECVARVTYPDGRTVEDVGVVSINGLKGDAAGNAIMKCVTKAKRRAILSACGLGMLDETETETIPGASVVQAAAAHAVPAAPAAPAAPAPAVVSVQVVSDDGDDSDTEQQPAGLDRDQAIAKIRQCWRALRLTPPMALQHLQTTANVERVSEMTDTRLAAYLDLLQHELALQAN